jgi:hypothetical protein
MSKTSIEYELVLPEIGFNVRTPTLSGKDETSHFFKIPIKFMLTRQQNYFSIEISFIIGLRICIFERRNQDEY